MKTRSEWLYDLERETMAINLGIYVYDGLTSCDQKVFLQHTRVPIPKDNRDGFVIPSR